MSTNGTRTNARESDAFLAPSTVPSGAKVAGSTDGAERTNENMYATPAAAPAGSASRDNKTLSPGIECVTASTAAAATKGSAPSTVCKRSMSLSLVSEVAVTTAVTAAAAALDEIRFTNKFVSAKAEIGATWGRAEREMAPVDCHCEIALLQ